MMQEVPVRPSSPGSIAATWPLRGNVRMDVMRVESLEKTGAAVLVVYHMRRFSRIAVVLGVHIAFWRG